MPKRVAFPGAVRLSGRLSNTSVGGLTGKLLLVQRHVKSHPWRTVKKVTTRANGAYSVSLSAYRTWTYRVRWAGVITSVGRRVVVY